MNATGMAERDQRERDDAILQRRVEQFVTDYAPDFPRDHAAFVAALHMIVRQASIDASAAATRELVDWMSRYVSPPVLGGFIPGGNNRP
jgi:hypothetical protein